MYIGYHSALGRVPWAIQYVPISCLSKREGISVCVWLIHFVVQWRLTQHCKATILQ